MGLSRRIKDYFRKKIRFLIRAEIHFFEYEKANELQLGYQKCASYDSKTVRIEPCTSIFNNQNDKNKIRLGNNTWLRGQIMILKHGGEVIIGEDCFIGENTKIWSSVKIQIGNRVLISHNVNIHDNISHPLDSKERHKDFLHVRFIGLQNEMDISEKEIIIGDDVWIGFNCTILKGVTIGDGAIIGANTLITKDVPAYAVVVGNPPQIIKHTT